MLELHNVKKTFNKGTINEKKALQGLELTLRRFCDDHRRKRCRKINDAEYDRRRLSDR